MSTTSGLGVQQAEDALGAGDGALQVGPQRRDLLDRLVEALDVAQEGDDQAERDRGAEQGLAAQQDDAADHGRDGDRQVAQRLQRRRQRGGEGDGADVGVAVGRVRLAEGLDVGVLAAEGLHLAHAGDALLQVGVDLADLLAGAAEGLARLAGEPDGHHDHHRHHRHADERVGHALAAAC